MAAADVQQTPDPQCNSPKNISRLNIGNMRCGPHCRSGEISENVLRAEFHEMFRQFSDQKKKIEPKKSKKKSKTKPKDKHRLKGESAELPVLQPPFLAVRSNPSSFVVFAIVRLCVLEKQTCEATRLYLKNITSNFTDSESDDDDENSNEGCKVPKIVGIGLCSVFELIKESQKNHPHFCRRALQALLDMLQGQQPEGLKGEPCDVIDSLFDLLLDISSTSLSSIDQAQSSYSSTLTSYACACLLSLVIASGDTGKLLCAASAMLMSSQFLALEEIPTPGIMASLQRSVHAVLLGKTVGPDWLTHGFPCNALCGSFSVQIPKTKYRQGSPITSDGKYLYIYSGGSIYKVGSGFGGTVKGQIIMSRGGIKAEEKGWLGYCKGYLYFQPQAGVCSELMKIDVETLKEKERVEVDISEWGPCAFFTDGDNLGLIVSTKEDSFIIKMFRPDSSPLNCIHELNLKLARKCLDVFGSGIFEEETPYHTLNLPAEDEPLSMACGKDFALLKTVNGKLMYSGKAQSMGIKQGGPAMGKWTELPITKSPKIVQYSIGHDGLHALLVAEDGSVFFAGTARRGEDGDQSKGRRQPKPTKPKKMIKLEGHHIITSACNNGTSALVSQSGELYLFGKDTAHADHNTGLVTDIKESVTQVALGKAHIVALTNKGHVFTFGINHKGQCGREFIHGPNRDAPLPIAMATAAEEDGEDDGVESEEPDTICSPGRHQWNHDYCMVCTVCGECTGYGASCIASGRPDRNPGLPCGCGAGDSGCIECGCCRSCARENDQDVDVAAAAWGQLVAGGLVDNKQTDIIVFDVRCGRAGMRIEDRLRRRIEEYKFRQRRRQMMQSVKAMKSGLSGLNKLRGEAPEKSSPPIVDDVVGSDQEREATKLTALPPARMSMPTEVPVIQIACGLHHNVLLVQTGEVYTFGNNQHGQLGHGDFIIRGVPTLLKFPSSFTSTTIIQVAAGSCHTVLLNSQGQVYTFGSNQKGQLRRQAPNAASEENRREKRKTDRDKDSNWNAVPGLIPNIGTKYGRRATWIGASGDQTFVKIDESLINSHNLNKSSVVCSKTCIGIIPNQVEPPSSFKSLVISKSDGSCRSFSSADQLELKDSSVCLDSIYNVLWRFCPSSQKITLYNIIITEIQNFPKSIVSSPHNKELETPLPRILSPDLMLPFKSGIPISRAHAALNILSSLDTLTLAQEQNLQVLNDDRKRQNLSKVYSKEDFSVVNRFDSHGGGWGYSGHSIEAIRVMADSDIILGGVGLFGGRGEYTAKIKIFDIGAEGGDQEIDGDVLIETDEIPYECGARHKYPVLFDEPIQLQANRWYVVWARISGPSSDCGSSGQSVVTTEDQVVFYFKSSKKSNNGTDVNAGQIPQLLYRTITPDSQGLSKPCSQVEPVTVLSKDFSRTVNPNCFHSLLRLLRWAWQSFKAGYCEAVLGSLMPASTALIDLERLEYICTSCLHLLKIYINEIYPKGSSKKVPPEVPKLAECIADVRALLQHILSDKLPTAQVKPSFSGISSSSSTSALLCNYLQSVLDECHETFLSCYHAFYPSSQLKWRGLCDLLLTIDVPWVEESVEGDHLLAAVLASLCSSSIRLTSTLPVTLESDVLSESSSLSPDATHDAGSPIASNEGTQEMSPGVYSSEIHKYPVLVDCVTMRTEREGCSPGPCSFKEVLDRLLSIVTQPLEAMLHNETVKHSSKLITNACAFIAVIVAELSYQSAGTVLDMHGTGGQVLHLTPSRFTKVSQNRTWNTGNGSPDAICFSVDRSGIMIAGVTVYGGVGNEWHYELELLDDQSGGSADPSHTQRWKTLAIVRGTFGPEDCYGDVAEIKFERPVPIKENVKYAVRLRNHGSRTNNGDGGLTQVKGPDGSIFTFTDCSLSFNGTNHTRGQIPQLLYYSTPQDTESVQSTKDIAELQARRSALSICTSVVNSASQLFVRAQSVEDNDVLCAFGTSHLVTMLLPLMLAHLGPVATSDPRSAVQVLSMVQQLLPLVASLNKKCPRKSADKNVENEGERCDANLSTTSNHYAIVESDHPYRPASVAYYKVKFPPSVQWLSLEFDPQCGTAQVEDTLQVYIPSKNNAGQIWLNSSQMNTVSGSQDAEDDQYVPYWPVFRKFSGSFDWPSTALLLPGSEVVFSLETASDYVKDEKACFYGFRCQVIGFECPRISCGNNIESWEGLKHLERELAYLGGMCAASLMRRDVMLPPTSASEVEEDLELIEELSNQVYKNHSTLLSRGFALAHPPSIHQALEGVLPFSSQSNEHSFLKDFVACAQGTSGGRLARWLQPESYVDPKQCELLCSQEELKCGWPAIITVITKDQYGKIVQAPSLKVEVLAVPMNIYDKEAESSDPSRKLARVSKPETGTLTFGGHHPPNLDTPYEISVKDKMFYYAITVMKEYENYSFEELRFASPAKKRLIENMLVRTNNDGTYTANWTPGSTGWYLLRVVIDGFEIGGSQQRSVEVKEPPQGLLIPTKQVTPKASHQPSRIRKFSAKFSAGLRVRSHPSLQSEQIGTVHVNDTISFIDELRNDDGVWVRLNPETVRKYCQNGYTEAWCLQYNQHLGKTLLIPVEEPKSVLTEFFKEKGLKKKSEEAKDSRFDFVRGPGLYHVIKCGASGHNIRSRPSLKASAVGMLVLGNTVCAERDITSADGVWVKLDKESKQRYCFNMDGEAWTLVRNLSEAVYLQHESDIMFGADSDDEKSYRGSKFPNEQASMFSSTGSTTKGFDFATAVSGQGFGSFGQSTGIFTFGSGTSDHEGGSSGSTSPFVFGSPASTPSVSMNTLVESEKTENDILAKNSCGSNSGRVAALQRWLKEESSHKSSPETTRIPVSKDIPPELHSVSVKELVKAIGESRANGNAATPPRTPPNTPPVPHRGSRSNSPLHPSSSPKIPSRRSSSPIPIAAMPVTRSNSESTSPHIFSGNVMPSASPPLIASPKNLRHQPVNQDAWPPYQQNIPQKSSSGLRRSSLQSDTSVGSHFSSILKELSQSSATGCIGCITQRNTISPISTPGTPGTPATPGTPKKETNCIGAVKSVTQTGTQTSPDSMKSHFNIGTGGTKEEVTRISPKLARKDRTSRQFRSKRERVKSPGTIRELGEKSKEKTPAKDAVKEAMTPSVAECLRAVFAAFLWHEGIVHDAMACASFLKFNPTLSKQITSVPHVPVREKRENSPLTKEQKARYRHSVEVASPSLLTFQYFESFNPSSFNANINKNKLRKTSVPIKEDSVVIDASRQVPSVSDKSISDNASSPNNVQNRKLSASEKYQLPQSLQHLVILWEQISSSSLRVVSQQLVLPSPVTGSKVFQKLEKERNSRDKDKKVKKKKEYRPIMAGRGNLFAEAAGGSFAGEREGMCELCGYFFPHPVTYHMKQAHPGCGDHAGGKGYNSGGNFCGGWAGNCGDGGMGGSSWYLICDRCREKFIRQKRQSLIKEKVKKSRKKTSPTKLLSPLPPMEAHQIMKKNALFLLELSPSTSSGIPKNAATPSRLSFYNSMPSVHEQNCFDSSPFTLGYFQCLDDLGVQQQYKNMIGEEFLSEEDIRALQNGAENLGLGTSLASLSSGIMRSLTMNGGADVQLVKRDRRKSKVKEGESKTRTFHRSISVGLTSRDWNKQVAETAAAECRVIMTRKRNNSSGCEDTSTSFLCQPSAGLTKLVSLMMDRPGSEFPLNRPVMVFMLQRHDLDSLQLAMKQALRKAACRVYALQALNWLLRCVTQPMSLHDLLWCFVAALSPAPFDKNEEEGGEDEPEKKEHDVHEKDLGVCEHPLSDITIAGEAAYPLPDTFHAFLQTVSDLMMLLPMGSSLQQIAMRCWCLKFHPEDHSFLHRSHVFSNISKILSRTEDEDEGVPADNCSQVSAEIEALKDVTPLVDIKASSRQAMVNSLTDNTTETFWESGDEDRNKIKMLNLTCGAKIQPRMVYIHIDNCRDLGNKVSGVTFKAGPSFEEMIKLKQLEVENRYIGWINCDIPDGKFIFIRIELKGPDNTLRLRQVKVLGTQDGESLHIGKKVTAIQIQQKNCEAETLKVFRLLTSQVFGKLIIGEKECNEDKKNDINLDSDRAQMSQSQSTLETNDLKEHMVGILFSRSKLTHLQKQVCSHIVAAIRKEASRVRDEWEALLCSKSQSVEELPKSSDAYCFEMLSMVLALSGSNVGRTYLAQQAGLLRDLFSLLHTGSARVQRQVTSLLRRVLPEVSPPTLASILGVTSLPPSDFSIITESNKDSKQEESSFDIHSTGILDVFLSCIAKALTVQTKVKGSSSSNSKGVNTVTLATSIHPRDNVGSRWWLRGCMARKLAEVIIQLLKDMAAGKLTEAWASVTKGAIAENILNLTKLEESHRSPSECIKTPTLWLALASLCVLDQEHVERLSSGQWVGGAGGDGQQAQPRPFCDNHDDSETPAIILCSTCGNMCAECDRYLHLNRKTRCHQRQVFKEEEEAIKVDLHEGCGRTKLFWVMALADSKTLKAMVEFREGTRGKPSSSGVCRFCGSSSSTGLLSIGNVCNEPECQEHASNACSKMLPCGHMCGGIYNESPCLPCLHRCSSENTSLKQDADDMCMICFIEALACAPAIQLTCGHVFHLHCCRAVLTKKWSGPRITFRFSLCPICQAPMDHPVLKDLLDPAQSLFEDVKRKALMRLEYEGLHKAEAITTPGARFYNDPAGFAMDRYAYYVCYKCKKAYYGGEARCDVEAGAGDDYDPTELVCGACSDVSRAQMCPKHGTDFLEYKCRYCCSVAVFFCFGTTHFCNACHDDFQRVTNIPKAELPHCPAGPKAKQLEGDECPLHVKHPSTGEEFALGCGVCRNAHTF